MGYEKSVLSAANGKSQTPFSLIVHQYLKMAIILNAKNVALLVKRSKEVFYAWKNTLYTMR